MGIEIRELIIKVKIGEPAKYKQSEVDLVSIRQVLLKECRKEIKKQLEKTKER